MVLEAKYGSPKIVNDGVTIAREVYLEDPVENIGASLVRQAAARTNDVAGKLPLELFLCRCLHCKFYFLLLVSLHASVATPGSRPHQRPRWQAAPWCYFFVKNSTA